MKRYMTRVSLLLLTSMLISCGGGGGDSPSGGTPPGNGGSGAGLPSAGAVVEESNIQFVTFSGDWKQSTSNAGWSGSSFDSRVGWSGGAAMESTRPGATASFTFTGTSVRWLSMRGRNGGIALVRVDGGEAREVDLFGRPADELRTPAITIYGLSAGPHTLTIEVTGRKNIEDGADQTSTAVVVVDAFEVEPQIVSHIQDADPASDLIYSDGWTQANNNLGWSGSGAFNNGEQPPGAKVTETAGATVTYKFRGTSVSWIGYSGPDAGIALVSVDGGEAKEVDTYSRDLKVQQVVFTASGLTDAKHELTIKATGRKRPASTAAQIFVDAFDVTTPGRRYEQGDLRTGKHIAEGDVTIDYVGSWNNSNARVWTQGWTATTQQENATVTFNFTGTSVSWIGCEKSSAGGTAKVFIDDVFDQDVSLFQQMPMEGYQREVYRKDGLSPGPHKLTILVTSQDHAFVVVDAFDVRQ